MPQEATFALSTGLDGNTGPCVLRRTPHLLYLATIRRSVRLKERLLIPLLVLFMLVVVPARGQYFRNSNYWKTHRGEYTIGLGISNFLGELGGRDQIGSPFVWDLEFSQTKPAASIGYRYYTREKQSLRFNLTYGILAGNDNLTQESARMNRNLNFKTDIFEFQMVYEIHLYKEELGHIYDLRGVKGQKSSRVGLYFFGGIGGFYFNPKGKFNNAYVELRPLHTEGEGLSGGPPEYSKYQFCVPLGFGLRRAITKQLSIGLELQYTKTFTDYVDDVGGVYYDNHVLAQTYGAQAAYLADPSLGLNPGQTNTGAERGYGNLNDAYLFLKFQLHYKIYKYHTQGGKKYRTRIRRQKIVF